MAGGRLARMGADGLVIPWVPNPKKIFRTIKLMEGSDGPLRGNAGYVWKVQQALEDAGVIFIDAAEEGPGVRLTAR